MTEASAQDRRVIWNWSVYAFAVVLLISLWAWVRIQGPSPPPTVASAGTFVDAQYLESFDSIKSRVSTSEAVFLVDRPVTGWKGQALVVLTKGDGSSWLCDQAQTTCHRIFR